MNSLDPEFSSEEESEDGSDIETVPMETITGDETDNENENAEVKTTENPTSDNMEPIMTATSTQQDLKSAATSKSPSKLGLMNKTDPLAPKNATNPMAVD